MIIEPGLVVRSQTESCESLLLVDDHPVFRAGLAAVLMMGADLESVLQAGSVEEAERLLRCHPGVRLVLFDWHMPPLGGCQGLRRMVCCVPGVPVVVITADDDDAIDVAARQCGAVDVISKSASAAVIRSRLAAWWGQPSALDTGRELRLPHHCVDAESGLSPRQLQVLSLLARGCSNKRIASALAIREPTVRAHLTEVFRILKVRNRTEAALAAARVAGVVNAGIQ